MPSTSFFATKSDLLALFRSVETTGPLSFIPYGDSRSERAFDVYTSGASLPRVGEAAGDSSSLCDIYVVTRDPSSIRTRHVSANSGPRFLVDQLENPDTITINVGGALAPVALLRGTISTASDTPASKSLFSLWKRHAQSLWKSHRGVLVGADAETSWLAGTRLTGSIHSPPEYDLVEKTTL